MFHEITVVRVKSRITSTVNNFQVPDKICRNGLHKCPIFYKCFFFCNDHNLSCINYVYIVKDSSSQDQSRIKLIYKTCETYSLFSYFPGDHCDECAFGYYGNPANNGSCPNSKIRLCIF